MTCHSFLTSEVCFYLSRVNAHKVSGPDGLPGRVLRVCTEQLADVFTHIFKLYLVQPVVLTYYKTVTIVPVPKHYNFAFHKKVDICIFFIFIFIYVVPFALLVSQVKSSHLYLYSAFNNTNCNKALHSIKIGKLCQ